jgi:toxin ParE1/3/4
VTEVVYTDAAERDLTQISSYIAADDPRAAVRFVERLRAKCEHLKHFSTIGRRRPDIHPDIRSLPHGSYVVYFEWDGSRDEMQILRIWHGSRRTPRLADLY